MIELAFFRAFLAWESFLEESFILYLMGKKPPRGKPPRRFAMPPTLQAAEDFAAEGQDYAKWNIDKLKNRAERFFKGGGPFTGPLQAHRTVLTDAQTLRNAIAHNSASARRKFETLVRRTLGTVPPDFTVGKFLDTTVPTSSPPNTFLDSHLEMIEFVARQIVPS
jgi:hypothetical protein